MRLTGTWGTGETPAVATVVRRPSSIQRDPAPGNGGAHPPVCGPSWQTADRATPSGAGVAEGAAIP